MLLLLLPGGRHRCRGRLVDVDDFSRRSRGDRSQIGADGLEVSEDLAFVRETGAGMCGEAGEEVVVDVTSVGSEGGGEFVRDGFDALSEYRFGSLRLE
jgi:hypothetical protein